MDEIFNNYYLFQSIDLNNPEFEKAGKVHDWRNHIPMEFIEIWNDLTEREKKIIIILCQNEADAEEWD